MLTIVNLGYFITAITFIFSLKQMSHPSTARKGIIIAGWAMAGATLITFVHPTITQNAGFINYFLIMAGIAVGGVFALISAKKVAMTDMPQMIAIYNGVGGGAAACIAAVELIRASNHISLENLEHSSGMQMLAIIGALIGAVSFTGSLVAWAKLDGRMNKAIRIKNRNMINFGVFFLTLTLGIVLANSAPPNIYVIAIFFILALGFGWLIAVPIGGADMPVVISLFNALTGLAVALEGLALNNGGLVIAGIVVGAAGTVLTQLMAKAMNRPLSNILFSNFGDAPSGSEEVAGTMKDIAASDAAINMSFAQKVIIIPGYGLAVAQAQHKVAELTKLLQERDIEVKFAIHPVAGRMPGHMNVLLAESGIPYDLIMDLDEINPEFETCDFALVIGANDVVNPVARTDKTSPIYGMPILNADMARQCFVIKRGKGAGFSGIENHLFYLDNTTMVYGDAQKVLNDMITAIKTL